MKTKSYRVVNNECIQLLGDTFEGITYKYGKVEFKEPDDQNDFVTLSFEYNIIHGEPPTNLEEFKQYIGDILVELIEEGVKKNDIVYTGGVDE